MGEMFSSISMLSPPSLNHLLLVPSCMLGRLVQWPPPSFDDWSLSFPPTWMVSLPPTSTNGLILRWLIQATCAQNK